MVPRVAPAGPVGKGKTKSCGATSAGGPTAPRCGGCGGCSSAGGCAGVMVAWAVAVALAAVNPREREHDCPHSGSRSYIHIPLRPPRPFESFLMAHVLARVSAVPGRAQGQRPRQRSHAGDEGTSRSRPRPGSEGSDNGREGGAKFRWRRPYHLQHERRDAAVRPCGAAAAGLVDGTDPYDQRGSDGQGSLRQIDPYLSHVSRLIQQLPNV